MAETPPENSAAIAPPRKVIGRPFLKGATGNPRGRPRVAGAIRELAQEHGVTAIERLAVLLDSKDPRVVVAAAQVLLDRGYGKPDQALHVTGTLEDLVLAAVSKRQERVAEGTA